MGPLDIVQLTPLMHCTSGRPEISVGLIDGPVALNLPDFAGANIREVPGKLSATCNRADTAACSHGTFVTGILAARRGSLAPAICPGCTLLLRPIFAETMNGNGIMPSATPEELADAIVDSVDAGARVVNLSSALVQSSPKSERVLEEELHNLSRCHLGCGGRQSGNRRKFSHHPPSVGHSRGSLQHSRQAP
jgi:subtilisin family serine protease